MIALYGHIQELRPESRGCCFTRRKRAQVEAELAKAIAEQAALDRAFDRALEAHVEERGEPCARSSTPERSAKGRWRVGPMSAGRSKWGNPFVIGRDGTRDAVIAKYRARILRQPLLMAALDELGGTHRVLVRARALPCRGADRVRQPVRAPWTRRWPAASASSRSPAPATTPVTGLAVPLP